MIADDDIFSASQLFVPTRLALARELRGLTKAEVATMVEKSASAISQFEGGRARPDPQTLRRLALALGMPLSFFSRRKSASLIPLDACHFRSLRSASQRDRRRLLASGSLLCELVTELEELVVFPPEDISRLAQVPRDMEDIERIATDTRSAWGLGMGPIANMVKLVERQGALVLPVLEGCDEVDAFSLWHERRPMMFLILDKESTSRARFDAAHELGHLIMHADVVPGSPEIERQAHRFASAFLMPRDVFLPECPRRLVWPHFHELKRRWKVSLWALIRRVFELGCLSEATYRRACVQLNQKYNPRGIRQPEPYEPPIERPTLLAQAIVEVADERPLTELAQELGLSVQDLQSMLPVTLNPSAGIAGTGQAASARKDR